MNWEDCLDPTTLEYYKRAQQPNNGASAVYRTGSIILCAMLDENGVPNSKPTKPGYVVWSLLSSARQTKVYLNSAFRDRRFRFDDNEPFVSAGAISRLELKSQEPHPERSILFPDSRSTAYEIVVNGIDELTSNIAPGNWDTLRLTCTAALPDARARLAPTVPTRIQETPPQTKQRTCLVYCTEWESGHGGLSTFNREFCVALARLGEKVYLRFVPSPGAGTNQSYLRQLDLSKSDIPQACATPMGQLKPDLAVAHDRITGPQMLDDAQHFFSEAKTVLFIHTDPRIDAYSDYDDSTAGKAIARKSADQDDLLRRAHFAVGVGPRLHGHAQERVSGFQSKPTVLRFDPGFRAANEPQQSNHDEEFHLLLIARSTDVFLKGRTIAMASTKLAEIDLTEQSPLMPSTKRIQLGIRGVDETELAALSRKLGSKGRVSPYTVDPMRIAEEFRRAHLVLMPSRLEGFGLVALEALQANRPVLATANSGFADFLVERFGKTELRKFAEAMIVPDRSISDDAKAELWAERIVQSIQSYDKLLDGLDQIREQLTDKPWEVPVKRLLQDLL